jgi:hypothetical protein
VESISIDLNERLRQKIGRPSRVRSVAIRFTETEADQLASAAAKDGDTLREWARDVLLREARRADADALFTEVIATRMLLVNLIKPLVEGATIPKNYVADAMAEVRRVKHKAAKDVRQQYNDEAKGGR